MKALLLSDIHSPFFAAAWQVYEDSFPVAERRSLLAHQDAMAHPCYKFQVCLDNSALVGFLAWWAYEDFRYLEHFAIAAPRRSGGLGSKMLLQWIASEETPVILEIEEVVDDITRRRLHFYRRLGFIENTMDHSHPSYADRTGAVPMRLLSYPDFIDTTRHNLFMEKLRQDVWPFTGY